MPEDREELFRPTDEQSARIRPLLPADTSGKTRVDDRHMISGIIRVIRF